MIVTTTEESVSRTYRYTYLLGKNAQSQKLDLGHVHSNTATSLTSLIVENLRQQGQVEDNTSPNFLVRNWPSAFTEWSTKAVVNIFYASPIFPRLVNPQAIRETIARGCWRRKAQ